MKWKLHVYVNLETKVVFCPTRKTKICYILNIQLNNNAIDKKVLISTNIYVQFHFQTAV